MNSLKENRESQVNEDTQLTIFRIIRYLFSLYRPYISIGFAVPFVAGAIFSYISLGFSTGPSLFELIIPIIVGTFMGCGFFALDSYFDIETDKFNPRKKTLPHVLDQNLLPKWVGFVSALIFFGVAIILSGFISIVHVLLALIGIGAGILYTTPPFRFKGRIALDLLINVFAFGMVGSIYGWLMYSDFKSLNSIYGWFVLPFCSIITYIIVFPTPMIDYEADKKANINSTVVKFGLKKYAQFGLISLSLLSIFMAIAEIKIFYDFNTYSHLPFELPILIGLMFIGGLLIVPYYHLYRKPTSKTAFYMTGLIAILVFIGVILALQVLNLQLF